MRIKSELNPNEYVLEEGQPEGYEAPKKKKKLTTIDEILLIITLEKQRMKTTFLIIACNMFSMNTNALSYFSPTETNFSTKEESKEEIEKYRGEIEKYRGEIEKYKAEKEIEESRAKTEKYRAEIEEHVIQTCVNEFIRFDEQILHQNFHRDYVLNIAESNIRDSYALSFIMYQITYLKETNLNVWTLRKNMYSLYRDSCIVHLLNKLSPLTGVKNEN